MDDLTPGLWFTLRGHPTTVDSGDWSELAERCLRIGGAPKADRSRVAAALHDLEAQTVLERRHTGALLAALLGMLGTRIVVCAGTLQPPDRDVIDGLLGADLGIAVVAPGYGRGARVDALRAAGIGVEGDERSPEAVVAQLGFQEPTADGFEGACEQLRADGSSARVLAELAALEIPIRQGWVGSTADWVSGLRRPRLGPPGDPTRARAARRGAVHLAWTDEVPAVFLGRWAWRASHRAGDSVSVAFTAAWLAEDQPTLQGRVDRGVFEGRSFARAFQCRAVGDFAGVLQQLGSHGPLVDAGPAEAGWTRLLRAEAMLECGDLHAARREVRRARVLSRQTGDRFVDSAACALGIRAGLSIEEEAWASAGILGWWWARTRLHRALERGDVALARAQLDFSPPGVVFPAMRAEWAAWRVRLTGAGDVPEHPRAVAWRALARAAAARRAGDMDAVKDALVEAQGRFEGVGAVLCGVACRRAWGLFEGTNRGGNAIDEADQRTRAVGLNPALAMRSMVPEVALSLDSQDRPD